jgi:hypothetical protein
MPQRKKNNSYNNNQLATIRYDEGSLSEEYDCIIDQCNPPPSLASSPLLTTRECEQTFEYCTMYEKNRQSFLLSSCFVLHSLKVFGMRSSGGLDLEKAGAAALPSVRSSQYYQGNKSATNPAPPDAVSEGDSPRNEDAVDAVQYYNSSKSPLAAIFMMARYLSPTLQMSSRKRH